MRPVALIALAGTYAAAGRYPFLGRTPRRRTRKRFGLCDPVTVRPACGRASLELSHAGCGLAGPRARLLRTVRRLRLRLRSALKEAAMIFDYSLAAPVTVGLMIYLVYALLRPEHLHRRRHTMTALGWFQFL